MLPAGRGIALGDALPAGALARCAAEAGAESVGPGRHDGNVTYVIHVLAALLAMIGTGLQAHANLAELKQVDPDGARSFHAVDGLKTEFRPMRNPLQWYGRQLEVKRLLADSPTEAALYRKVWRQLISWALLVAASFMALVGAVASI